jgi:hypothetical protein
LCVIASRAIEAPAYGNDNRVTEIAVGDTAGQVILCDEQAVHVARDAVRSIRNRSILLKLTSVRADLEIIRPMLDTLPTCISEQQREQIEALLLEFNSIFSRFEYDVGRTPLIKYRLELKDPSATPVCQTLTHHALSHLRLS